MWDLLFIWTRHDSSAEIYSDNQINSTKLVMNELHILWTPSLWWGECFVIGRTLSGSLRSIVRQDVISQHVYYPLRLDEEKSHNEIWYATTKNVGTCLYCYIIPYWVFFLQSFLFPVSARLCSIFDVALALTIFFLFNFAFILGWIFVWGNGTFSPNTIFCFILYLLDLGRTAIRWRR